MFSISLNKRASLFLVMIRTYLCMVYAIFRDKVQAYTYRLYVMTIPNLITIRRGTTPINAVIGVLLIFVLGSALIGTVATSVTQANLNGTEGTLAGLFAMIFAIVIIVLGIGYIQERRGA